MKTTHFLTTFLICVGVFSGCNNSVVPIFDLRSAVMNGSISEVRHALLSGADVNSPEYRPSLLLIAVENNDLAVAEVLIEAGINIFQDSPMEHAVFNNNFEMIKLLFEGSHGNSHHGIVAASKIGNIDILSYFFSHPLRNTTNTQRILDDALLAAASNGHLETIDWLIQQGANINPIDFQKELENEKSVTETERILLRDQNRDYFTPLNQAAMNGHIETVQFLHKQGASLQGSLYYILLQKANNPELVNFLLSNGLDIKNEQTLFPTLLLKCLYSDNNDEYLDLLVNHGADLTLNIYGESFMLHALKSGEIGIIKKLAELGMELIQHNTEKEENSLTYVVRSSTIDTIKYVMEHGGHKLIEDPYSHDIIITAVLRKNLEIVKYLHEHGADLHAVTIEGQNVLHLSTLLWRVDIAKYALQQGIDIDQQSHDGLTPLMISVLKGNTDFTKYLLEQGADTTIKDQNCKTALDYANEYEDTELIDLLSKED